MTQQALFEKTGPSIDASLAWAVKKLNQKNIGNSLHDARLLLTHTTGYELEFMIAHPEHRLTPGQFDFFAEAIEKRSLYEPVSKIVGKKEFWSLPFQVNQDTLDPRPDSEALIEAALACLPFRDKEIHILDLGTGSGCLLLSLLHELPHAKGIGVDISEKALKVAKSNAKSLGLGKRSQFIYSNWGRGLKGDFEAILVNPPYISTSEFSKLSRDVALYDPPLALRGGKDGYACYRDFAPILKRLLSPSGLAFVEIGAGQDHNVSMIFKNAGLGILGRRADLTGTTRCLVIHQT